MRWAKTIKYQASVMIDLKAYNIVCEGEANEDFAVSINGEYICDVSTLPTYEELLEMVSEQAAIEEMSTAPFPSELINQEN